MLNVFSKNINSFLFKLLITQRCDSFRYKYSKNSLNIYSFKISPLNLITYQVLDFSKIKKNIFYILQHKFNLNKISTFFFYKNVFYSNTTQKLILDWYERELYEKKTSYCFNLFDKRNLLFNYNLRYSFLQTTFNLYFWAFTDIQTQTIKFNNNLRIIL